MLSEKQQKRLLEIQQSIDGGAVQPDELAKVIRVLLEVFKNIKSQLEQNIQAVNTKLYLDLNSISDGIKTLENKMMSSLGEVSSKSEKMTLAEVSKMTQQMQKEMESKMAKCMTDMLTTDMLEKDIPKLGMPIRDALELLPQGEKLNIDAIEDLQEELDKVRNIQLTKKDNVVYVGGGGGSGGRIVKSYDLSSVLDGVTKTFSLPAFYRIISVHLSSVPNILRETVDYTSSASTFQITFTSQISESTSLASGQSCVVVYSE